jgi:hypothetical protein
MVLAFEKCGAWRVAVLRDLGPAAWTGPVRESACAPPCPCDAPADAVLLDCRKRGTTPSARRAAALVETLVGAAPRRPSAAVAILTNPGAQYGGARCLCSLGELRGCLAAAFADEAEAWAWLRMQVG